MSTYRDTTGAYTRDPEAWVRLELRVTPAAVDTAGAELAGRSDPRLVVDVDDTDLAFLGDLPPLHHLEVPSSRVRDVAALAAHADTLRVLQLQLGRHPVSVEVIGALPRLRQLYLLKMGPAAVKGVSEAVARAVQLQHLVLHSVTIPTLAPLTGLPQLRGLALKLGGAPDLTAFPDLPALRFFEAWQVRGLTDLRPVAASPTLEVLHLESLPRAPLPDFSRAVALQHVLIDGLAVPEGLAGLAAAPALRHVTIGRPVLDHDDVEVLRGHPTLQAAWIAIRGRRVTDDEMRLGLAHPHSAPFVAFGAGVMGLPPDGWDGEYLVPDSR